MALPNIQALSDSYLLGTRVRAGQHLVAALFFTIAHECHHDYDNYASSRVFYQPQF